MRKILALFLVAMLTPAIGAAAETDPLAKKRVSFSAENPDQVMENTVSDLRAVVRLFRPEFSSGTQVIKPLEVGGSKDEPTVTMTVRKCVLFICREVELDGTVRLRERNGDCRRDYTITVDLRRSSRTLTDQYSEIRMDVCYRTDGPAATLNARAVAVRAPTWSAGTMQDMILKMLKRQVGPLTKAIRTRLDQLGARVKRE